MGGALLFSGGGKRESDENSDRTVPFEVFAQLLEWEPFSLTPDECGERLCDGL